MSIGSSKAFFDTRFAILRLCCPLLSIFSDKYMLLPDQQFHNRPGISGMCTPGVPHFAFHNLSVARGTSGRSGILREGFYLKKTHFTRRAIMLVVLIGVLSLMSILAFAAEIPMPFSNKDYSFFTVAPNITSFAQIENHLKENTTPAWLRIDSIKVGEQVQEGTQVRVRVVGSYSPTHACGENEYNSPISGYTCRTCTRCTTRGNWVPYVLCSQTVNYAVSSNVRESGYQYSSLGFQSTNLQTSQEVRGWWSADSTGYANYERPEAG